MSFNQWQQVKEIVQTALEIEPEKRARFVAESCSDDEFLRREVESLLASHESAGDFIEAPAFVDNIETLAAKGASPELQTGERVGRFEIRSLLGRGGMGAVYLAKDTRLNRKVALKALPENLTTDEQSKQRFLREAKAASALNHPHIITIYDVVSDGEREFIAMEYVEGETFRDLLSRGAKPEIKRATDLVAQAAAGLAAAHEAGIVHRDIKPENLMLTRDGQVKILDFGLAKPVENRKVSLADSFAETARYSEGKKIETLRGMIMGTIAYMSPEQAEGHTLDCRTDIFSLGVVFYEMLAGKKPFEGKSAIDTLHSIINEEPRPAIELNPTLPAEINELLGKAMAKDPRERYRHAGDFELDLRRFKRALETNSLLSGRTQIAAPPATRKTNASLKWLAALGILALTAVAAVWLWQRPKVEQIAAADTPRGISLEKAALAPITIDAGFEGEPTFAPDNQTIAYVSDRTGNFDIFLRNISGGPDINLTNNPADDMQPAFSPDGKQIAFVSSRTGESDCLCFFIYGTDQPLMGGALWVMPALGGSPRRIVETGTFPSWSPDGSSIVFTQGPWYGQKLFKIAAVGGEPQEIGVKMKGAAPFLAYPSYSPDGRRIVFEAANKIFVVSAEGGDAVPIVTGKRPVWTADGQTIIYTNVEAGKNYSLWQIPFSAAEGKPVGDASPMTVGRGHDTQTAVSRDGKLIAYSALDVAFNLGSLPFDAEAGRPTGTPNPVTSGSDKIYFFGSSADGNSFVFDSHRGASSFIWKVEKGAPPVQLTSNPGFEDVFPRWSPDDRTVAFGRKPANKTDAADDLWFMEGDGANPRLIKEKAGVVSWMPGGKALAYLSFEDGQLYIYDTTTNSSRKVTDEEGIYGGFAPSPDGKWVAYMSIAEGNVDIRAVAVEGGESVSVVATPRQDFHPFISPSGKWLYFQLDHKNLYRVPGPAQNWRKAAPEKATNFPESGLFIEDPQLSRDGRQLLYSRRSNTGDIWVMSLNH